MCLSVQQCVAAASPGMFSASCTPVTLAQQAICADMQRYAGGRKLSRPPIQQGTSRLHTRLCQRKEDWMDQSLWHLNGLGIVRSLTVCMHTPNWRHSIFEHMHLFLSPKNKPFSAEFVHWVSENQHPFQVVNDHTFHSLMKTGRPECYIPSAEAVSCDVKNVFVNIHGKVAKMLQVSLE